MPTHAPQAARRAAALAALVAAGACADSATAPRGVPSSRAPLDAEQPALAAAGRQTDGYIVFLKEAAPGAARAARAAEVSAAAAALGTLAGAARVQPLAFVDAFVARGPVDVAALRADPRVARVARNAVYRLVGAPRTASPAKSALAARLTGGAPAAPGAFAAAVAGAFATNATFYRRGWQWNLRQIGADRAAATGAGRVVCVIDAGVSPDHQDLRGKVIAARAFPGDTTFGPEDGDLDHGSYVASIVTGNGIGIASIAPGARLLSANIFGPTSGTSGAQIIDALGWCSQNGADVINISVGGAQTRGTPEWVQDSTTLTNAVQAARGLGSVVVVAAGNEGQGIPNDSAGGTESPAEATGVIAVGATMVPFGASFPFPSQYPVAAFDTIAWYSTRNSGRDALGPGVRIYAPGGSAVSTAPFNVLGVCSPKAGPACSTGGQYSASAGTSGASPHVAGVAALIASRTSAPRSLARARAIEACLLATADRLPAGPPFYGRGRVNARRATTERCPGL